MSEEVHRIFNFQDVFLNFFAAQGFLLGWQCFNSNLKYQKVRNKFDSNYFTVFTQFSTRIY